MANTKRNAHMWTKDDIKKVAKLWSSKTMEELAKELDVRKDQILYIVTHMRKAGFELPRKHKTGYMEMLLKECLLELK